MRNIAQAIADGKTKFLDRVRQKAQVEMLRGFVRSAKDDELRQKYPAYIDYEKHQGEKPTGETADHAKFPSYTAFRSDLASLGRQLEQIDGTKKLGASLLKVADDVTSAYLKFAKENLHKVSTFSRAERQAKSHLRQQGTGRGSHQAQRLQGQGRGPAVQAQPEHHHHEPVSREGKRHLAG